VGLADDLEEYRRETEAFLREREEALYLHGAGHRPDLPLAQIHARHADLFTDEVVAELGEAAAASPAGDRGRSLRALRAFAVQGRLEAATASQAEAIAAAEAAWLVRVEGEELPYRGVAAAIANEPDRHRRLALERARLRVVDEELTPLHEAAWHVRHDLAGRIGGDGASYRDLWAGLLGVELSALAAQCERLLRDTDDLYRAALDPVMRSAAGVALDDAVRADLPRLLRAPGQDAHFPSDRMVEALERGLDGLGLDLRRQPNVVIDAEPRPSKDPRAFCAPVEVPDRVFLVVAPIGGRDDYLALFHEAGHAEHFANVGRDLPVEFRRLGDDALTECYAFLIEGLLRDGVWLSSTLGFTESADHLRDSALGRLYLHRRYAAKLLYEMELHAGGGLDGKSARYSELLSGATAVAWPEETFLDDLDQGFYCASYLRAWALEVGLRGMLREQFGSRWFAQRRAGSLLRELWEDGQRLSADELASELGLGAIDLSVLTEEAAAALG
jgi:hypothetical protein